MDGDLVERAPDRGPLAPLELFRIDRVLSGAADGAVADIFLPKWFADRCSFIRVPGETTVPPRLVRWAIKDTPAVIRKLKEARAKLKAGG